MNKDTVYLYWTSFEGESFKIGILTRRDGMYYFEYVKDLKAAFRAGFSCMVGFPSLGAKYESEFLFPVFSTRLPSKNRPDMDKILKYYNMEKHAEYELLKISGAKSHTDYYEFRME